MTAVSDTSVTIQQYEEDFSEIRGIQLSSHCNV